MRFLMISGMIFIVIAAAFIVICLAAVKYFAAKKENNSYNDERCSDQTDRKTKTANSFSDSADHLCTRSNENINLFTMAATGLLIQETLNNDSNRDISDCGNCSSDCNHDNCNSIDFESLNCDSSDFSCPSDFGGGSDCGGSCDF